MKLSDKHQVLLAPLCSARAIGTRFVAIPEKQVTLEVKTHPSTPSHNYTGLNLAFTGYMNEYHGQQSWVDWAPLLSWCVIYALFGGAFFRVYCRKRRLRLKDQ
uniref:Putative secreted protein n=1 Tax=Ixodes ricinus TaxID=34613 RepID=V5GKI3_IXORI